MRAPDIAPSPAFGPPFPAASEILGHPLPHLHLADRLLLRGRRGAPFVVVGEGAM